MGRGGGCEREGGDWSSGAVGCRGLRCRPGTGLCRAQFHPTGRALPWPPPLARQRLLRAALPRGAWFPFQPGSSPGVSARRRELQLPTQSPRGWRLSRALSLFPRYPHPAAMMLDVPFLPFCALLGGLGLACVAFVSAWCQYWRGGFSWDGSAQTFNWHPVLMVTGLVVLYGAGKREPAARRGPSSGPGSSLTLFSRQPPWFTAFPKAGAAPSCPGRCCTARWPWPPSSWPCWGWRPSSASTTPAGRPTCTRCTAGWGCSPCCSSPARWVLSPGLPADPGTRLPSPSPPLPAVGGWFRSLPAALGSRLAPRPLQTRPRLLRLHHPALVGGFVRVGHQREAFLQPVSSDGRGQNPLGEGAQGGGVWAAHFLLGRRREASDSPSGG